MVIIAAAAFVFFRPVPIVSAPYTINKFKPYHIVLGKDSIMYSGTDELFIYKIQNPDALMTELGALV